MTAFPDRPRYATTVLPLREAGASQLPAQRGSDRAVNDGRLPYDREAVSYVQGFA